ncbi:hypothetical protein E3Q13_04417 [Wallemia mellicola]|nr:hypothetical protein E3Q13_04417 [Wallemia mellicola]
MAPSTCRSMFHLYQKTEVSKSSKSASRTTTESENSVITIEIGIHYLWLVFTNIRFSLGPASINIPHDNKIKLRAVIDNSQIDLFVHRLWLWIGWLGFRLQNTIKRSLLK